MKIETKFDINEVVNIKHPKFGDMEAKIVDISVLVYNAHPDRSVIQYRLSFTVDEYFDYLIRNEASLSKLTDI